LGRRDVAARSSLLMGYWKSMRDDDVENDLSMGSSFRELAPHGWGRYRCRDCKCTRRLTQESSFPISLAGTTRFGRYHCVTLVSEVRQVWLDVMWISVHRVPLANAANILYSFYINQWDPLVLHRVRFMGPPEKGRAICKRQRAFHTKMTMKAHRWSRREEDARQGNIPKSCSEST
jgi:hypothetical protein